MSTYHTLVCDKHRQQCPAFSLTMGGPGWLGDGSALMPRFLCAHQDCALRVVSEHRPEYEDYAAWDDEGADLNSLEAATEAMSQDLLNG